MYKVYDNKLLDCLKSGMLGIRKGGINCNGPTYAADTTVVTEERGPLQTLLRISDNYSGLEQYLLWDLLQLLKSVVLTILPPRKRDKSEDGHHWTLKGKEMSNVFFFSLVSFIFYNLLQKYISSQTYCTYIHEHP